MSWKLRRACMLGLNLCLLAAAGQAAAQNTPLAERLRHERIDYASAAVGGIGAPDADGGGSGSITLGGISGSVRQALLYWEGIDIEYTDAYGHVYTGGDSDYDEAEVTVNGQPVSGTRVAGSGNNNNWGDGDDDNSAALYRADVTALVSATGNGVYLLEGLADGAGHSANGASLIVYYDDGDPANDVAVTHYEGMESNLQHLLDGEAAMHWDFDFPVQGYVGGAAYVEMHVADGQVVQGDTQLLFQIAPGPTGSGTEDARFGTTVDGLPLWGGDTVPDMGVFRAGEGLWDLRRLSLAGAMGPPGDYAVRTSYVGGSDALSLLVALVVRAAEPQPPMFSPNPADFGDVLEDTTSAPQTLTLRNLASYPIRMTGSPYTPSSWFTVVSNGCASGTTLAPGASCTVEVACTPTTVSSPGPSMTSLRLTWTDASGGQTNESYTNMICKGVPDAPFSRLELDPWSFDFGTVAQGAETPLRRFTASNTGSLPLRVTRAEVDGTFDAAFEIVQTDCIGADLAVGQSCVLDLRFAPTPIQQGDIEQVLFLLWDAADGTGKAVEAELLGNASVVTDPGLYISPPSMDFGEAELENDTNQKQVFLYNTGNEPITLSLALTGADADQFSPNASGFTACHNVTLAADGQSGDACSIVVLFDPSRPGDADAALTANWVSASASGTVAAALHGVGAGVVPPPQPGQLAFGASGSYSAAESAGSFAIPVTRSGGIDGAVSVTVSSSDGSALAPGDYGAVSAVVTFADGEGGTKTVNLGIVGDSLDESDEQLGLALSNPTGGAALGSPGTASLTIVDDDATTPPPEPAGQIRFAGADFGGFYENEGFLVITIERGNGSAGAVAGTVTAAGGTATAGQDFQGGAYAFGFADGDAASKTVQIPIVDDALDEPAESVQLSLAITGGAATLGSPAAAVVSIDDDDEAPVPTPVGGTLAFVQAAVDTGENAGSLLVTLRRSGGDDGAARVRLRSADGSARAGSDYTAVDANLEWADGDSADKTLSIVLLDDGADEPAETFSLQLSDATGAALGAPATLAVTLADNDEPPAQPAQQGELSSGGGAFGFGSLLLGLGAVLRRRRRGLLRAAAAAAALFAPALQAGPFYLGAQGGVVQTSADSAGLTEALQQAGHAVTAEVADGDDGAWGVYGGWYFHRYAAVELGYRQVDGQAARVSGDLGDGQGLVEAASDHFAPAGDILSAALRLDVPLWRRLSLRYAMGVFAWNDEVELKIGETRIGTGSHGSGLLIGLGLDLRLGAGWSLGTGIEMFESEREQVPDLYYGRLEWRFGE